MWRYPYEDEDHGDGQADERWRRALTREDALSDMETGGIEFDFPVARATQRQSGNMWDHVNPATDHYVPEHERKEPILTADELLADIRARGA